MQRVLKWDFSLFNWFQIQKYYTMKQQSPELFKVSPPKEMQHMLEMQIQNMLPLRDPNGRQVYIFRVGKLQSLARLLFIE